MTLSAKHPDSIEPYFVVWCTRTGLNDGSANDTGELQGATIATSDWALLDGDIVIDSGDTASVSIRGVTYSINTVATVWLSGGTDKTDSRLKNTIVTSDDRTLVTEIIVPVRSKPC